MGHVCRPAEITCVDNGCSTCLTHCVMLHPSGHNNWCCLCPKGRRKQSYAHNQPSLSPHHPWAHGDHPRRPQLHNLTQPLWMLHPRVTVTTANDAGGSRACTHNQPFRDPLHPLSSDKWERSIPGGVHLTKGNMCEKGMQVGCVALCVIISTVPPLNARVVVNEGTSVIGMAAIWSRV